MQLRHRLLTLVCALLGVSILLGSKLAYWQGVHKVETEMRSAQSVGASYVRDALKNLDPGQNHEAQLARIVRTFDGDRHLSVSMYGNDTMRLIASKVRPPGDPAPGWLYRLLAQKWEPTRIAAGPGGSPSIHISIAPDPTNEISEVWQDAKLKLAIMAGFSLLVLAGLYAVLGHALRPLEELAAGLARVSRGDYRAHVQEDGPEELRIIYRAFNNMTDALNRAEDRNQALTEQLTTVQEEERSEIGRNLHDDIGPFLFAVDVDAQTIPVLIEKGEQQEVVARSRAIRQSIGHMQKHLRDVLSRLRPATFLDLGLTHAVEHLLNFWRIRHPDVAFTSSIADGRFSQQIEEVAFRMLQEGTNNAIRHGKPSRVALTVSRSEDDRLIVEVEDDGVGRGDQSAAGFGLRGMKERVRQVGGELFIQPGDDQRGLRLRAEIPLPSRNDKRQHARLADAEPQDLRDRA